MKRPLIAATLLALSAALFPAAAESPDPYGICYHITFMDDGIQMRRDLRLLKRIDSETEQDEASSDFESGSSGSAAVS